MVGDWLPVVLSSGWASGVNAYGAVLLLGVLGRYADLDATPSVLTESWVLGIAAVLFLLEAIADKIPYVDSAWDSVHTVVRPVVGGALGALLSGDAASWEQAMAAGTGGGTALLAHVGKAGLRLAVNTTPEPFSNIALSLLEDGAVAGVLSLLLVSPWVAAAVALVLLAVVLTATVLSWRLVRRGYAR